MNAPVQRFYFEPGTLIAYDGYQLIVTGTIKAGLVVRDRFVGEGELSRQWVLNDQTVNELICRHDVEIDASFGLDGCASDPHGQSVIRFEDRPEAERREAHQREAWCLAARSVLGNGPFTETQIARHFSEIRGRAYDRQRLLDLGTTRKNRSFRGRSWGAKSVSNFCKAYFSQKTPHPRILLRQAPGGNTYRRLTAEQSSLLDACCKKYLSTSQPSKASIERLVERRFREVRNERLIAGNQSPFPTPHRNTIYRRLARFSLLERTIGREGYREAQKKFSPTQHGIRALKPGELIEIDFWKGDVFTFSKHAEYWDLLTPDLQKILKDGVRKGKRAYRQRLWICIAIDVETRMPLGLGIAEKPNSRTVIEVLDQIVRDKSSISRAAGCKLPWSQHCGLGTVITDTGNEFFNSEVETAIIAAGGSVIFGRAAVPMDKPFIERFFGSLRTEFADELPGKTGFSPQCLVAYDKEGMAAFNTEQFRLLLLRHIVDYYPLRAHTGLMGKRPIDAWRDAQKYGAVRPPSPRNRRTATGLKLERILSKEGIKIFGIPFSDPSLFPVAIRNGSRKVEVRVDPNDLREVTIVLDGQRIYLANQRPDLAHHSIRTLMAAIKKMTTSNPKDLAFYEYVLAKHATRFTNKITTGIEAHGLPSTEITADEVDWFERSFCLKLQIVKTPEATPSADMDTLLNGGTGPGIFSATEIAVEKANVPDRVAEPETIETSDLSGPEVSAPVSTKRSAPSTDPPPLALADDPQSGTAIPRRFSGAPKGKGTLT